jgi:hypothetical protein
MVHDRIDYIESELGSDDPHDRNIRPGSAPNSFSNPTLSPEGTTWFPQRFMPPRLLIKSPDARRT